MPRNKPIQAQQPAPAFANDSGGFWAGVLSQNATQGISSLLPAGTVSQSDTAIKGRVLGAQIGWQPYEMRWNGNNITGSLSDAQFFLEVEAGGDTQQGRLTVLIDKLQFRAGAHPKFQDTISIQAGGKWHDFTVAEMIGEFDYNEPGLVLYLEKDSNELGN